MSDSNDRLIRLKEVLKILPLSKATWYAGIKSQRFPGPIKLGPRLVAWRYKDIRKLVDEGWGK